MNMRKFLSVYIVSVLTLFLSILAYPAFVRAAEGKIVVIIYLSDMPLYYELANAIEKEITQSGLEAKRIVLQKDSQKIENISKNTMLISIGDLALVYALENMPGYSGISFMAYNSKNIKRAIATNNWVVIPLYAMPEMRIEYLRQQMPYINTVATIYTAKFRDDIDETKIALSKIGIQFNAVEVTDGAEALRAINELFKENDCFLIYHDPLVNNELLLNQLFKLQYDNNKPVIGLSQKFVQKGALMALTYDLRYIPYIAKQMLSNNLQVSDAIKKEIWKGYVIYVNAHTAKNMNLQFPNYVKDIKVEIVL